MRLKSAVLTGAFAAWAGIATLGVAGCTGTAAGIDAYDEGRYPEALSALRQVEQSHDERGAELVNDARYTLYRGLTELAVGNAPTAYLWLSATKEALARDPEALDPSDRGRLDAAWQTLGKMPAQLR